MPPVPQEDKNMHQKEFRTESIGSTVPQDKGLHTESTPEIHALSSQPQDKGKAPATETSDDDGEETKDEVDPAQFRLARRRSGSSKITI